MTTDPGLLLERLRTNLPDGERIEAVIPLTTGFSNETYLLDGANWILRLPPSAGAMVEGHDVVDQGRIYRELGAVAGGPPVPGVIAVCEDASLLGVPYLVMECVAGEPVHDTDLQAWFTGADDTFRQQICRDWITAFARLALLDPLPVLGEPVSPEDDARMWREFARKADCPELVAAFDRLLARPASLSGPPAVVHGDVKLSNFMFRDGRLSAVLDWEMALNGEPLADLGYALFGIENEHHGAVTPHKQPGMFRREQVIALWESVSGRSAHGVVWHEIAQLGKVNAIVAEGTNMFVTGRSNDPKLAYFKKNLDYYMGVMVAMLDAHSF